jgi:RimJ/RimL family protein N-acetyltransferase
VTHRRALEDEARLVVMGGEAPGSGTGDVRLRDVVESDLPIFFEDQLDPEGSRMAAFTPRDREAFMEHWSKVLADQTVIKKTVVFEGQVAGNVVSFEKAGRREVGYWIGRRFWGKGIATRALAQLLDQVRERPLYAVVAKHNIASIRVVEKCGFVLSDEEIGPADESGEDVEEVLLKLGT